MGKAKRSSRPSSRAASLATREAQQRIRERWQAEARRQQERNEREARTRRATEEAEAKTRILEAAVTEAFDLLRIGVRQAASLSLFPPLQLPPRPAPTSSQFEAPKPQPQLDEFLPHQPNVFARHLPGADARHARRIEQANADYESAKRSWEDFEVARRTSLQAARAADEWRYAVWESEISALKENAETLRRKVLNGEQRAVERCATRLLNQSIYPQDINREYSCSYVAGTKTMSIGCALPEPSTIPLAQGFRFSTRTNSIVEEHRTKHNREQLYRRLLCSIALRTAFELLSKFDSQTVSEVSIDGYVDTVDEATGKWGKAHLVGLSVSSDALDRVSLVGVDPIQCLLSLGGVVSNDALSLRNVLPRRQASAARARPVTLATAGPAAAPGPGMGVGVAIDSRYRLVERLGSGSFGTVWRARDLQLDRFVALKVLHTHLADEADDRKRFINEARAMASLTCPYIVRVFDVAGTAHPPYFVMEYIAGITIAKAVAEGKALPLFRIHEIVPRLCEAIDSIHAAKMVHRDIKAENVLLTGNGEPRLMDFGIALAPGQTRLTGTGYGLGTPESAAPEQIGGGSITSAIDIYALGILVFQMVSGRLPFTGDVARVLYAQAHEQPPDLLLLRPEIGAPFARAVDSALAKRPEQRPRTAKLFWQMATGQVP